MKTKLYWRRLWHKLNRKKFRNWRKKKTEKPINTAPVGKDGHSKGSLK